MTALGRQGREDQFFGRKPHSSRSFPIPSRSWRRVSIAFALRAKIGKVIANKRISSAEKTADNPVDGS